MQPERHTTFEAGQVTDDFLLPPPTRLKAPMPPARHDGQTGYKGVFWDMRDPSVQPPNVKCIECGQELERHWITPRHADGRPHAVIAPHWNNPKNDPCPDCMAQEEAPESTTLGLQKRAGMLSRGLRGWRIDHHKVQKRNDDDDAGFMHAVRTQNGFQSKRAYLGVLRRNLGVYRAVSDWHPAHGSFYLQGAVGTGKTALAAAKCTSLLQPSELRQVTTPDGRLAYTQRPGLLPLWTSEGEAFGRHVDSWKKDANPLARLAEAPVLFWDDLGTETSRPAIQMVRRLVRYRYEHALPTFFTTNMAFDELAEGDGKHPGFGARIADRIRQMCRGEVPRIHELEGESWR